MNSEERGTHYNWYLRNLRRPRVDLNAISIIDNQGPEESSVNPIMQVEQPMSSQGVNRQPAFIDLEAISDDVIILSPRSFAEAQSNAGTNRGRPDVVDVDAAAENCPTPSNRRKHRRRSSQRFANRDLYRNPEGSSSSKMYNLRTNAPAPAPAPAPSAPLAKPPSYECPVCLLSMVEETSTKCGHIFCNKCIKTAIETKNKCPTCRRKVNKKDLIRVYLPSSS